MPITKKPKTKSVKQLRKEADEVFSQYIRLRHALAGYAECVTCKVVKPWKQQQCGHYEDRGKQNTRFDEENCHVQCVGCNVFKKGNYPRYAQYLVTTFGDAILDELERRAAVSKQWKDYELQEIIDRYKKKVEVLKCQN